jgi:hypothetical protein
MQRLPHLAVLALCSALAVPGQTASATAQTDQDLNIRAYIELLRGDVNKSKSQVMGQVMALDPDQSAKFWPVYRDYQAALAKIGDRVADLIKDYAANYANMTDAAADNLSNRMLTLEQERTLLKKQYYERVKTALGAIHATRFLQVENQLERLVDLQVSASLPVIH